MFVNRCIPTTNTETKTKKVFKNNYSTFSYSFDDHYNKKYLFRKDRGMHLGNFLAAWNKAKIIPIIV